jgi:serine protease AprX
VDPYVIAVGAAALNGGHAATASTVAPFSSRGSVARSVDVVAPGVSIASLRDPGSSIDQDHPGAVVNTRFFRGSGTSQAAAVTSGAAALVLSSHPSLTPDQVKAVLRSTATPLAGFDRQAQGSGMLNVDAASQAGPPADAVQSWPTATGAGSIEASRGGEHVALDGVELTGEQDIMGSPWSGAAWAAQSASATAWNGGMWNGQMWSGSCWCGTSWAGATWQNTSWTGNSWTGKRWTSVGWQGMSWTGKRWTGTSWTGKRWTGASWTGKRWTSSPGR